LWQRRQQLLLSTLPQQTRACSCLASSTAKHGEEIPQKHCTADRKTSNKKAELLQRWPRDAAVNFDTYRILQQVDNGTYYVAYMLNTATFLTPMHLAPNNNNNNNNNKLLIIIRRRFLTRRNTTEVMGAHQRNG